MGHLGHERVYQLARDRVFWPNMQQEIEHYVTKVCPCLKQRKPHVIHTAPLGSIVTSSPLELICVDFLHLDTCSGGYEYLLVITDHFTRFSQAYPARNKSSTTAANIIFNNFICRFGIPSRILHDQGKEWENKIFEQLEKLCGMNKSRTSPYHPMWNGQCERMNQTLLAMLKTLPEAWKSNWKDHVNKLIFAYNCTSNSVTGYSPYCLLFGYHQDSMCTSG